MSNAPTGWLTQFISGISIHSQDETIHLDILIVSEIVVLYVGILLKVNYIVINSTLMKKFPRVTGHSQQYIFNFFISVTPNILIREFLPFGGRKHAFWLLIMENIPALTAFLLNLWWAISILFFLILRLFRLN